MEPGALFGTVRWNQILQTIKYIESDYFFNGNTQSHRTEE